MSRLLNFLRSSHFPIFMIVFTDVLGAGITIPVLPLFAKHDLAATAWQITLLTSVFFGAQFIAGPLLGRLSDRVGRRPVLIVSQAGTLAALLITASAPGIAFLYLARLIDGLTGGNISVAQAYLSDTTDDRDRARGLGLVNAAFSAGFVFGPAFGSLLAASFGPRLPFLAAAGVSLITILLATFLLPESLTPERRKREQAELAQTGRGNLWGRAVWQSPPVAMLLFIAFSTSLGFFAFQSTYVLWAERVVFATWAPSTMQRTIGWLLAGFGLLGIITQAFLVGPLTRRFGEKPLMVSGYLTRGLSIGVMALLPTLPVIIAVMPFLAIGGGLAWPALAALFTFVAPNARGQSIGLNQAASALGNIVGPVIAGFLFDQVHPTASILASAVAIVTPIVVALALGFYRLPIQPPALQTGAPAGSN